MLIKTEERHTKDKCWKLHGRPPRTWREKWIDKISCPLHWFCWNGSLLSAKLPKASLQKKYKY